MVRAGRRSGTVYGRGSLTEMVLRRSGAGGLADEGGDRGKRRRHAREVGGMKIIHFA